MKTLFIIALSVFLAISVECSYKKRKECVFPFKYNGKDYLDCVSEDAGAPWCSPDAVYRGLFYYCNDNEADKYEQDSAFLLAQQKLNDNRKLLDQGVFEKGSQCVDCDANMMISKNMVSNLLKIADDNDRNINYLMDVENKKIRDVLESNYNDVKPFLTCPNGWVQMNEDCVTVLRSKTLAEARVTCAEHGATVATVNDAKENEELVSISKTLLGTNAGIVISYNDINTEGSFVWDDKSETNYSNWNKGEPNNNAGKEDCTMVFLGSGKWNDFQCHEKSNPVCRGNIIFVK